MHTKLLTWQDELQTPCHNILILDGEDLEGLVKSFKVMEMERTQMEQDELHTHTIPITHTYKYLSIYRKTFVLVLHSLVQRKP